MSADGVINSQNKGEKLLRPWGTPLQLKFSWIIQINLNRWHSVSFTLNRLYFSHKFSCTRALEITLCRLVIMVNAWWCWTIRDMRVLVCWVMRALFVCGGFHHLKVKGQKATTKDAPVLALAPHSSFFDALPVVYLGGPSIVAKAETGRIPFFGSRSLTSISLSSVRNTFSPFHLKIISFLIFQILRETFQSPEVAFWILLISESVNFRLLHC